MMTKNNDRRKSKQKMMMSPRVGLVTITKVVDKYLVATTGRKNAEPKIDHSYHVFFGVLITQRKGLSHLQSI